MMTPPSASSRGSSLTLLVLPLLVACSSASVTTDAAPGFAVPAGATYAWGDAGSRSTNLRGENDPAVNNDIMRDRLQHAVDAELARKGYRLTDSASATFLVHYHVGVQRKVETVAQQTPGPSRAVPLTRCAGRRCYTDWVWVDSWPPEESYRDVPYTEGTLMIDLERSSDGHLMWRGVGQDEVDRSDATEEGVGKAVRKVLSKLPATKPAA